MLKDRENNLESADYDMPAGEADEANGSQVGPSRPGVHQSGQIGKSQKIAAIFLAFFAVFIVIIWALQFKQSLTGPLAPATSQKNTNIGSSVTEADSEAALKTKDTDRDGLTDWDELNIYLTSPYLEDSDSDGFSDRQEIESGNDPNCPEGRDCYGLSGLEADKTTPEENSANANLDSLADMLNLGADTEAGQGSTDTQDLEALLGADMNAATLRQMLIEGGIDKAMLDQVSDEELLKSFYEVIEEGL